MRVDGKSSRFHERTNLKMPVEVNYREDADTAWQEITQIEDLTICGGGFTLSRPVEPNRMINLRLRMPGRFRLFDFGKDQYDIWGVVRSIKMIPIDIPDEIRVKVGVALTGSRPPSSFLRDPTTLYDLKPVLRDRSLWDLRELPRRAGQFARFLDERQKIAVKVILGALDENGRIAELVSAETQDISENGMAVITKLSSEYPKYVLIKTSDKSLSLLAKVRGIHVLEDTDYLRMHLEFISGKWVT